MRRLCQTLLEVPPACRHTAPPPLSRPVTKQTELTDRPSRTPASTSLIAPRGDKRRWATGSARSRAVPRDTPRWGGREGSAGSSPRPPRRPPVLCHGPLSEALPAASPLTSPHLTPPARRGAPRPLGAAPPPTRRPPPAALTPRAPAAASHPPRRSGRPARGTGPGGARPPPPQAPSPYAIPARRWGGAGGTRKWRRAAPPRALGPGAVRAAAPRSQSAPAGTWGSWVCSALPVSGRCLRLHRAA